MFRAIKIFGWLLGIVLLLLVGAAVALFFSENSQWVPMSWPYPQLSFDEPFAVHSFEVVLGVAASGWLFAVLLLGAALVLFPLYLRRARQYTATIKKLERELVDLRNLPLKSPAPLEDLPDEQVKDDDLSVEDLENDLLREEESAPA